jgi:hypothetical protein
MRTNRFLLPLALLALTISSSYAQEAGPPPITPCVADTLADYKANFAAGQYCSIGIMLYNKFDFQSSGTSDVMDTAADIYLTPEHYGFQISQTLGDPTTDPFVDTNGTQQYDIFYQFTIDPGPVAGGASDTMDPPSGDVSITQYFCNDQYLSLDEGGNPYCYLPDRDTNPPESLTVTTANPYNSITFSNPATTFGNVLTQINLNADDPATFDANTGVINLSPDPAATPEPASIALALGGLFLIWRGRTALYPR